ncbi:threonine synthase [Lactobacillus kalixensis]|uniref:Threonine synthase n=1 Tax=Lactobacillus kalixensis DSM 16043 TaxID=1423763 RepID=A0A0R1UB27_9LACO|nr:threonine synthase [Lactobacillus kalixensis]KRL90582.1 threonine synthase [Lactobacillus kalixensis DSM 16043]
MKYRSTRGNINNTLNSTNAIIQGLAPDSGLYVPLKFPKATWELADLAQLNYQEIAKLVFNLFFDDFSEEEINQIVNSAYGKQWDTQDIAPLKERDGNFYLELFHGPTLAFKDIALQALPLLMTKAVQIEQINHKIIILTATSGDTGSASMAGFSNKNGTEVLVFYPEGGVSPVQLKQMLNQPGTNLRAFAIKGNFDDAQTEVKRIFNDQSFNQKLLDENYQFSSANSMNIGRLIPQIVYYLYSYGTLVKNKKIRLGNKVNFTVPTGNFGDILAAYYAKKLGLPINKLICASNENNVLTDFFKTGKYDRQRQFHLTNAPAMDILVSSNLERLLFDLDDNNAQEIKQWMDQLNDQGFYQVNDQVFEKMNNLFAAGFATQSEVKDEIRRVYEDDVYVIDPHTAVGSFVTKKYHEQTGDKTPTIIVSTASPYKFPETVFSALTKKEVSPASPALNQLDSLLNEDLVPAIKKLFDEKNTKETVISINEMQNIILKNLALD